MLQSLWVQQVNKDDAMELCSTAELVDLFSEHNEAELKDMDDLDK